MTTEIRSQLNVRLTADSNISVSVSTFIADENEAFDAGKRNAGIINAYIKGYGEAAPLEEQQ